MVKKQYTILLHTDQATRGWAIFYSPAQGSFRSCLPQKSGAEKLRLSTGRGSGNSKDLICADDTTMVVRAAECARIRELTNGNLEVSRQKLGEMGLKLNVEKTSNVILDPEFVLASVFRRTGCAQFPNTKNGLRTQYRTQAKKAKILLGF